MREAVAELNDCPDHAIVVADSASETGNEAVEDYFGGEELTRGVARVEMTFSSSMIETS